MHIRLASLVAGVALQITTGCSVSRPAAEIWTFQRSLAETSAAARDGAWIHAATDADRYAGRRSDTVRLAGAINETVSFRLALRGGAAVVGSPRIEIHPFRCGTFQIDAASVRVYRMHSIAIDRWPGWHIRSITSSERDTHPLDVLVPIEAPRGGLPSRLAPGVTYHFWIDVTIPKGTSDGVYASRIVLVSGNTSLGSVDVELKVHAIMLPDEAEFPAIVELDYRSLFDHHLATSSQKIAANIVDWSGDAHRSVAQSLLNSTMRMLQEHRLTPVLDGLEPTVKIDRRGEPVIDWTAYDSVVSPYMSGRVFLNRLPASVWPMPVPASLAARGLPLSGGVSDELLRRYLSLAAEHFDAMGWLDRAYIMLPRTAAKRGESYESFRSFAQIVREATGGTLAVVGRLFPQDLRALGWSGFIQADVGEVVDVWLPPAQFYDSRAMRSEREAGRRTWLAVDRPPFSGSIAACAPPSYVQVLSWQASALGAQGLFLGKANRWPDSDDVVDPQACVRHDANVLLYPGRMFGLDGPVPSVRLKHLRRAMQDAAYVRLLKDHGAGHIVERVRRALVRYAGADAYRAHFADGRPIGWPSETTVFDTARRLMAEEVVNLAYGRAAGPAGESFSKQAAWRRFLLATSAVEMRVDGTRVQVTGTPTHPTARIESTLALANHTGTSLAGVVEFDELPEAWGAQPARSALPTLDAGAARRILLSASAKLQPLIAGGSQSMPITLTASDGSVYRADASLALVTAIDGGAKLSIDGDLSDWPPAAVNVASGFQLVAHGGGAASREPSTRTIGFVMRDDRFLYIGVNCETAGTNAGSSSSRKGVTYDDMVPVGEELIEILIDPKNLSTRSPGDLFHIVVKRSGADLAETGIAFDPPCGPRSAWPVDLDVATRIQADGWTAEIKIPLDALSFGPHRHTMWGFNITRVDAAHQEFSTWSGALGNAYQPLSLGNLYLP
ncbi:MAG: DUF4091 domain-containing protein [Planctomycetes bacterium]|nr:DUF4091 domain-containing protein [Planctomycetota bacterium]